MRVVTIGFVVVLVIVSCGLAVRYNQQATYVLEELNKERYQRILSEENLQRSNLEISSLKAELKRVHSQYDNTEQALKRTKAINEDLKQRLDKAAEIQVSLDKRIAELQRLVSPL
jgi:septal ring factor EnvC (AmiA/AmiB activator)